MDPALTGRILRVVNSSFYGLRCEVADLNQALTLLGIKPLKLLALGFSLPDELFKELAAEQLEWYWTTTLTRAVAARLLSTELWHQSGDEAFIAGLMQDIGVLALLRELGAPYAKLLSGVMEDHLDLAALERDSLGFDHVQLSAAILSRWHLPQRIVDSIAVSKQADRLARLTTPDADLARILHLAELMAQLVGQRRLIVLPELMEAGGAYHDLTKGRLTVLIELLQPQVDRLAESLSLELPADRDYVQVLASAHDQLSSLTEELAGAFRQHRSEDQVYTELLEEAQELTAAMQRFLHGSTDAHSPGDPVKDWSHWHAPHQRTDGERAAAAQPEEEDAVGIVALLRRLSAVVPLCRARRQELSVLLMESTNADVLAAPDGRTTQLVRQAICEIGTAYVSGRIEILSITAAQLAVVLPDCERRHAVALANEVMSRVAGKSENDNASPAVHTVTISAGVATVSAVPKNFDPWRLVESAERCLYAARSCSTNAVKSIEI
jgi:hypothetical protein